MAAYDKSQMSEISQPVWKKGFQTLYEDMRREAKMKTRTHGVTCQTFYLDAINIPPIYTQLMYIE